MFQFFQKLLFKFNKGFITNLDIFELGLKFSLSVLIMTSSKLSLIVVSVKISSNYFGSILVSLKQMIGMPVVEFDVTREVKRQPERVSD